MLSIECSVPKLSAQAIQSISAIAKLVSIDTTIPEEKSISHPIMHFHAICDLIGFNIQYFAHVLGFPKSGLGCLGLGT